MDQLRTPFEADRCVTVPEIARKLNSPKTTVDDQWKQLGYLKNFDIWTPHELKEVYLTKRTNICDLSLKRNQNNSF